MDPAQPEPELQRGACQEISLRFSAHRMLQFSHSVRSFLPICGLKFTRPVEPTVRKKFTPTLHYEWPLSLSHQLPMHHDFDFEKGGFVENINFNKISKKFHFIGFNFKGFIP